jgi:hypothetical protein
MQARARGVMHQHPLRAGRLNARQHGIGALGAAINNGNLRMIRQRQLAKRASPGLMAMITASPADAPAAPPRRARGSFYRQLRGIAWDILFACAGQNLRPAPRRKRPKSGCHVVILGLIIDCFVLSPDCV